MKIKANTIKRAKRLARALVLGQVTQQDIWDKADRLSQMSTDPSDARSCHIEILSAVAVHHDTRLAEVRDPEATIERLRDRGFRARRSVAPSRWAESGIAPRTTQILIEWWTL